MLFWIKNDDFLHFYMSKGQKQSNFTILSNLCKINKRIREKNNVLAFKKNFGC